MVIMIRKRKLKLALEDHAVCQRRFGQDLARKLLVRMSTLAAASTLADFWPPFSGPERCHELKGDRKGQFSVDLVQPYRLLFSSTEKYSPADFDDERERWRAITEITIIAVEDTHG